MFKILELKKNFFKKIFEKNFRFLDLWTFCWTISLNKISFLMDFLGKFWIFFILF